ncbi:MAG: hypothetical protein IJT37_09765 [Lachnospiraceae bacterium]|nr:hypothetical protein [Lachnospiraceae bacterium]
MTFEFDVVSERRAKEVELQTNHFEDIPREYLSFGPYKFSGYMVKTKDEYYLLTAMSGRIKNLFEKEYTCYLFVYGKNHIFFDVNRFSSSGKFVHDCDKDTWFYDIIKNDCIWGDRGRFYVSHSYSE